MYLAVGLLVLFCLAFLAALGFIFFRIMPYLLSQWAEGSSEEVITGFVLLSPFLGLFVLLIGLSFKNLYLSPLRETNAQPLPESDRPALHATVRQLAAQFDIPEPEVRIVYSNVPNAYSEGLTPPNSAVVVTKGLLEQLEGDELEGVLAHELAHIKNRDGAVMSAAYLLPAVMFSIATAFSPAENKGARPPQSASELKDRNAERAARDWSLPTAGEMPKGGAIVSQMTTAGTYEERGGYTSGGGGGGPGAGLIVILVIIIVLTTAVSFLFWTFSALTLGVLARTREQAADRAAIAVTGDPAALASALETLDEQMLQVPERDLREMDGAVESLYVAPLKRGKFDGWGGALIPTRILPEMHPPTPERIERMTSERG